MPRSSWPCRIESVKYVLANKKSVEITKVTVCITYHVDEVSLNLEELQPPMLQVWVVVRFDHDARLAVCTCCSSVKECHHFAIAHDTHAAWNCCPRILHTYHHFNFKRTTIHFIISLLINYWLFILKRIRMNDPLLIEIFSNVNVILTIINRKKNITILPYIYA